MEKEKREYVQNAGKREPASDQGGQSFPEGPNTKTKPRRHLSGREDAGVCKGFETRKTEYVLKGYLFF